MNDKRKNLADYPREKTCFFTGNRPYKLPWGANETDNRCVEIKDKLKVTIQSLYDDGIRLFVCGMAQGGDTYFAEAVLELKSKRFDVTLECALPCPGQADKWNERDKERHRGLLEKADFITYVSDSFSKYCFFVRNRYMLDKSSVCIALDYGISGGTTSTVAQAKRKNAKIILLNE